MLTSRLRRVASYSVRLSPVSIFSCVSQFVCFLRREIYHRSLNGCRHEQLKGMLEDVKLAGVLLAGNSLSSDSVPLL